MKLYEKYWKYTGMVIIAIILGVIAFAGENNSLRHASAVISDQPPVFDPCPSDILHENSDDIVINISIFDENFSTYDVVISPPVPFVIENETYADGFMNFTINMGMPPAGEYVINIDAMDLGGNSKNCTFAVTNVFIPDTEPPVVVCPSDVILDGPGGTTVPVMVTDKNLSDVIIETGLSYVITNDVFNPDAGERTFEIVFEEPATGTYTISIIARDVSGNESECSFTLIQNEIDTQPPVITQNTINTNVDKGEYIDIYVTITDPPANGEFTVEYDAQSLTGLNTVQYIASSSYHVFRYFAFNDFSGDDAFEVRVTDVSGNTSTLIIEVHVIDTCEGLPVQGNVSLNPGQGNHDFLLITSRGYQITRDHLLNARNLPNNGIYYKGSASFVRFMPKGNPNDRILIVNNEKTTLKPNATYTFESDAMDVTIYNDKIKHGRSMGKWWLTINGNCIEFEEFLPQCDSGNCE